MRVPDSLYVSLCGHKATLKEEEKEEEEEEEEEQMSQSPDLDLCESHGGRPGFGPGPNSLNGLCGRKATVNSNETEIQRSGAV